ncbi:MAG: DinB family protein [Vicinamibacterales bacterium]
MALPPDLQRLIDEIDDADRRGAAIAASCTDDQFHWRPRDNQGWSIAQCLDHLGVMNLVYGTAIRTGIEAAQRRGSTRRGPGTPGYIGGKFVQSMEPPVTRRWRAPRKGKPSPTKDRQTILDQSRAAHDLTRQLIADAAMIDANRARFKNPFLPLVRFSVATGLFVIAAHDRRHLWQADQVKQAPGFPSSPGMITG